MFDRLVRGIIMYASENGVGGGHEELEMIQEKYIK